MALEVGQATNTQDIAECERVIELSFGRIMRLGVDADAETEQRAIATFFSRDTETGQVVATTRLAELEYIARSDALVEEYRLARIPADLRKHGFLSFHTALVPRLRGGEAMGYLFWGVGEYLRDHKALLTIAAIKPSLLPYFTRFGFRPFDKAFVASGGGYRIPVVLIIHDYEHMRASGSPFARVLPPTVVDEELLVAKAWFDKNRPRAKDLNVSVITKPEEIDFDLHFMKGLDRKTQDTLLRYAVRIRCAEGDVVVKEGVPENAFGIILKGNVDILRGETKIGSLGAGDIFGEIAFLLNTPRTATLVAGPDTEIAFVPVSGVGRIEDAAEEARFWQNLSAHLAAKLQKLTEIVA